MQRGFSTQVGQGRVFDDKRGGEDAGGQFSAVEAVAYKDLGEVFAFDWLDGKD